MSATELLHEEFLGIYNQWAASIAAKDRDWFERRLAEDFRYLTFEGGIWDKQKLIDVDMAVEGIDERWEELDAREIHDDLVLVVGRYSAIAQADDKVSDSMRAILEEGLSLRWSAVWRRSPDGWQVVLHHGTRITGDD